VDETAGEIKAIGGNVRASVRLKIFPAIKEVDDYFAPSPYAGRQIFAHLQLQADPIEEDAMNNSPTLQNLNSLLSTIIPNRTLASRTVK
jgi:hypothetical protein